MIHNSQIPSVVLLFFKKIITYESGSLVVIGASTGSLVSQLFKILFQGIEQRDMIMPLFLAVFTFIIYVVMFMVDFITGLRAARHEARKNQKKDYIESSKLWRSFWKFFGVVNILFILTGFCLMIAILDREWIYNIFLMSIPSVMLMVILFEFHSIGENYKRRYGYKPSYYQFFDKLTQTVENGIMKRIGNWFSDNDKRQPAGNGIKPDREEEDLPD
ncbi:hypothetical protein C7S20_00045 [Christiangramia fulva]|uniref:Uncharacterized protein n=1 Tax=Christiangramia fulva TaxID=2126553 RepID=A0A2R3Z0K7_9FLAO|nr:phage holin family protein [Christiangramia fulva]AVR43789.1 hypothetical protein C7S20_00045 [Christiangramia fulva]